MNFNLFFLSLSFTRLSLVSLTFSVPYFLSLSSGPLPGPPQTVRAVWLHCAWVPSPLAPLALHRVIPLANVSLHPLPPHQTEHVDSFSGRPSLPHGHDEGWTNLLNDGHENSRSSPGHEGSRLGRGGPKTPGGPSQRLSYFALLLFFNGSFFTFFLFFFQWYISLSFFFTVHPFTLASRSYNFI